MKSLLFALCLLLSASSFAQKQYWYGRVYDTAADARADIKKAVTQAAQEHKNVLLQIGGNWCIWCIRFYNLVEKTDSLKQLMNDNYVVVHVNYDQHNANSSLWKDLDYPQRFGFPVFVVLDERGRRIHTQNSSYLEEADGHSPKKVAEFFRDWSPAAVEGKTLR